jgi:hypothetical protein
MNEASDGQIAVLGLLSSVFLAGFVGSSSEGMDASVRWQHFRLRKHPMFADLSDVEFGRAKAVVERERKKRYGPDWDHIMNLWAIALPHEWIVPTLELAIEVILVDGEVGEREKQELSELVDALKISSDVYRATLDRVVRGA